MSAYIVGQNVIGYIVNAGIHYGVIKSSEAVSKARMLWRENQISVHHRYGDQDDYGNIGNITKRLHLGHFGDEFDPYQVIVSCQHLEYQSCEHAGYRYSQADQLLNDIMTAVEERHGISREDERQGTIWGAPEPAFMASLEIIRNRPVVATA